MCENFDVATCRRQVVCVHRTNRKGPRSDDEKRNGCFVARQKRSGPLVKWEFGTNWSKCLTNENKRGGGNEKMNQQCSNVCVV